MCVVLRLPTCPRARRCWARGCLSPPLRARGRAAADFPTKRAGRGHTRHTPNTNRACTVRRYWFFYGTAFVIGILEIIAGELETGVTRFVAVSVKTFVLRSARDAARYTVNGMPRFVASRPLLARTAWLSDGLPSTVVRNSLGAAAGMVFTLESSGGAASAWQEQDGYCGLVDLQEKWWRIPLYLLCSVSVLGQVRARLRAAGTHRSQSRPGLADRKSAHCGARFGI